MAQAHAERAPADQPLDGDEYVGDGSVDIRRRPSKKSASGRWKAAYFVLSTRPSLSFTACKLSVFICHFDPMSNLLLIDVNRKLATKDSDIYWNSITGVQLLERTAYYSVALSMVTYLVRELHQSTEESSTTIFDWAGVAWLLPLLGGFLADAYIGRFWMIVASLHVYVLV